MQTQQAKSHSPNTTPTKTAETPQKAAVSAASASHVPAWAGGMNDQIPAGLVLQEASTIPGIQAKLAISQPDDPYEQEADQVAEHVMRMPASINEVSTQSTRMEETAATSTSTAEAQKPSISSNKMTTSVSETPSPSQSEAENIDRARSMVSPAGTTPPQMATADIATLPSSSTSSTTAASPVPIRTQGREAMVPTPNLAERGQRLSTVPSQLPPSTMRGGLLTESGQTPGGRRPRQRYSAEEAEVEIQGIVATLSATAGESQERIQNQAETVKANITANAEALRQSIQAQVAEEEATIHSIFAEHRTSFLEMVEEARGSVAEKLEAHRGEVIKSGEDAQNKVKDTFTEHRASVEKAVSDKVAAAEQLRTHYTTYVHERTQAQSVEARRKGRDKAASYPKDERGQVQANAAQGVADRTATEIEQREPETVKAVEDITVDIPEQFRQKGQEALDDFDKGLPDLLKNIDQEVQSALDALNQQANQAYQQLDTLKTQVLDQLATLEEGAVASIQAIQPQADTQITNGVETALKNINSATEDAIGQINQVVDETAQTLLNSGTSDVETSHRTADEVLNFLNGATSDVLAGLQQSESSTADELAQVESSAAEGLQNIEQDVTAQIQTLDQSSNTTLSQFADTVDENLSTTVQSLDESLTDLETQMSQQLEEPVQKLVQGFDDTLQQAEAKIVEAVDAGLAKNDEALGQLDPEMQKAADDAAWDYDHPILSTLRDIGEVVLGVIVGILAVLLVVVIVIVAFKLLIVGLVALGVSLVVAEIIAAVIGIGLLAYSIYQAYQARVAQGAKGGWGTFGMALLDVAGVTDIVDAFTKKGISPFQRGYLFGKGATSLVLTIIGIRSAWKGVRGRFGGGAKGLPELPPGPEPPKALPPGPEPPKALPVGPEPPKALPPKSEAFPTAEPEAPKVESRPVQPETEPQASETTSEPELAEAGKRPVPPDWPSDVDFHKVQDAFKNPEKLSELTEHQRKAAADWYELKGKQAGQKPPHPKYPELRQQQEAFNKARADYIRNGSDKPFTDNFPKWVEENWGKKPGGLSGTGGPGTGPGPEPPKGAPKVEAPEDTGKRIEQGEGQQGGGTQQVETTGQPGPSRTEDVPIDKIRYSQDDVSPETREGQSIKELADSMRTKGFDPKEAVDVVDWGDGEFQTLDHRRLVAAKQAELGKVPAKVHNPNEPLPSELRGRFKFGKSFTDPVTGKTYRAGALPETWGEAAMGRAAKQGKDFPLRGGKTPPRIRRTQPQSQ